MSKKYIVYLYTIPHEPHPMYYVGITSQPIQDRMQHGYCNNPQLTKAIEDAGGWENINVRILRAHLDQSAAEQQEAYYIQQYNSLYNDDNPEECYGYNKQSGGLRGFTVCPSTRAKFSKAHSRPIAQFTADEDKLVAMYANSKLAAKMTKNSQGNIWSAANGDRKTAGGYRWLWVDSFLTVEQVEALFYDRHSSDDVYLPFSRNVFYAALDRMSAKRKEKKKATRSKKKRTNKKK